MAKSHYLEMDRLANVIAAIQILGVSDQESGTLNRWVAELEASEELTPEQVNHTPIKFAERKKWVAVFEQHPEFFKTFTLRGEQHVLLRWRYAQSINFNLKNRTSAVSADGEKPDDTSEKVNSASKPLGPDQIQVLINTAIELHRKETEAVRKPDRLSPFLIAAVGAALGTIVGGVVVVALGWMRIAHIVRIFD